MSEHVHEWTYEYGPEYDFDDTGPTETGSWWFGCKKCGPSLDVEEIERRLNAYDAMKDWQAEAITWLRHLEDEGDHTHDGLEEFIGA